MIACQLCRVYRRPHPHRPQEIGPSCPGCLALLDLDLAFLADHAGNGTFREALEPRSSGPSDGHATGKPGPRLPVSLDALSLLGPGSSTVREGGALPPAFLLREWATAWALLRGIGVHGPKEYGETSDGRIWLPVAGVHGLATWLRARAEWAATSTQHFPRFAAEVHATALATRAIVATIRGAVERQIGWCPARHPDGELCLSPLTASTWSDVITCLGCSTRYDRRRGDWNTLVQALRSQGLTRQ